MTLLALKPSQLPFLLFRAPFRMLAHVCVQVQDLHRGAGLVGEREVHTSLRLRGAHGAAQVPRLLLPGPGAAAALLARRPRPRRRHVPLHQVRRRLGQRPHGQGIFSLACAAHRRGANTIEFGTRTKRSSVVCAVCSCRRGRSA
jgi:hypothetical protein